jgi:predicted secreted hydrolase
LVNPARRAALVLASTAGLARPAFAAPAAPTVPTVQRGRTLEFPRDHGMHEPARIEWWYATGWLAAAASSPREPTFGFQVTFFRSRTGVAEASRSRFAARHLIFAHAAITDLDGRTHRHAQRAARFAGQGLTLADHAASSDALIVIAGGGPEGAWRFWREDAALGVSQWRTQVRGDRFDLTATLRATQPLLLQGDAGFSRKGPEERQASHYYSAPQLDAGAELQLGSSRQRLQGRAWLDHEWSDELMHPSAVGWDWIGINLFDGSALTAFQLRRADGSALWAGGSWRAPDGAGARSFAPNEVRWRAGRIWPSPATQARYPVQWEVSTPAGRHAVRALLDAQELDGRAGIGTVYWEGLAELLDERGRRVGLGYLEMTGYASELRLGREGR